MLKSSSNTIPTPAAGRCTEPTSLDRTQAAHRAAILGFCRLLPAPVLPVVLAEPGSQRNGGAVLRSAPAFGCAVRLLLRRIGPRYGAAIGAASTMEVHEDEQKRERTA